MNLPPFPWMQHAGHGYCDSQACANLRAMVANVLSSILMSSSKLKTVSSMVGALNSYDLYTWIIKVQSDQLHILQMAWNVSHVRVGVHTL